MPNATLLIIEANQSMQLVYGQLCRKFDHDAVFCSSGEAAFEAMKLAVYAAVLISLKSPAGEGKEVAAWLRAMELGSEIRTPIIALSAILMPEVERDCRDAGIDDFVSKPMVIDDFRKMLLRRAYQSQKPNLKLLNATFDAFETVVGI